MYSVCLFGVLTINRQKMFESDVFVDVLLTTYGSSSSTMVGVQTRIQCMYIHTACVNTSFYILDWLKLI